MGSATPSDAELREKIKALLPRVDLETMGMKAFIKLLSAEVGGVDLKPRKDFVRQALTEAINGANKEEDESEADEDGAEEEEESDDDGPATPPSKKGSGGGGLSQRKEISNKLAEFLGKGQTMARTDIVKELWNYIRDNNLQNPDNKREIILDAAMRKVFDCNTFTMFTMNKYIGAHIHPFKPVDLTPTPQSDAKRKRKARKESSSAKKKRKVGTQPPYRLSEELQAIVGTDILPRPQVVSKIWVYIKANNLQNENDKREIICDAKLKKIMKRDKISMFQMNVHIGAHLIEKLDKSEYQHDASEVEDDSD